MLFAQYTYILGYPVTVINLLWTIVCVILSITGVLNLTANKASSIAEWSSYLSQYGKSKTINKDLDVPKRWFTHFYILASIWNLICLISILAGCAGYSFNQQLFSWFSVRGLNKPQGDQFSLLLGMSMVTFQSFRRLYECLFVSVFSRGGKMILLHYVWGLMYYTLLAPTIVTECLPVQNLPRGVLTWKHCIAIILFIIASHIHHQSHQILADLRKQGGVKQNHHGIPRGGLFDLVSCPHYFSELIIYFAIYMVVGHMCVSWSLVILHNIIGQSKMAWENHKWYKSTFQNYPANRKALIPYIF